MRGNLSSVYFLLPLIAIMLLISCYPPAEQGLVYDPSKDYAAFLVLETPSGREALENMKIESRADNCEIGPIEFYKYGNTNYEPMIMKLTQNQKVKLLWLITPLNEVPDVQKIITKVGFKGAIRYKLVSPPTPQ